MAGGGSEEPKRQGARPLDSSLLLTSLYVVSCPHSSRAPLAPAPRALAPLPPRTPRWQPTRSFKRTPAQAQASTARPRRAGAFISFLPRATQLCPSPKAHARASLRRNRPRAGALLRAHTLWLQRRRGAGRARGASVPRSAQRAARAGQHGRRRACVDSAQDARRTARRAAAAGCSYWCGACGSAVCRRCAAILQGHWQGRSLLKLERSPLQVRHSPNSSWPSARGA